MFQFFNLQCRIVVNYGTRSVSGLINYFLLIATSTYKELFAVCWYLQSSFQLSKGSDSKLEEAVELCYHISSPAFNLIKYVGFFKVICPDYNSNVYILSLIQNRIQLRCEMVLIAVNLIALMLACANSVVLEMVKIGQNLAFL